MINTDILDYFQDNPKIIESKEKFFKFKNALGRSRIKSVQNSEDLREFLQWINLRKKYIKSYAEIGTSSGGTFYVVDSFLRHVNGSANIVSYGFDIINKIRDFKNYSDKYYDTTFFVQGDSQKIGFEDSFYDLIFIDANHHYHGVLADYNLFKNKSKYLAFHDIFFFGNEKSRGKCGVPKFWHQIKSLYGDYWEFVDFDSERGHTLGIGVIQIDSIKNGMSIRRNDTDFSKLRIDTYTKGRMKKGRKEL